jgi:N-acetylneuraminic acid mutarotase
MENMFYIFGGYDGTNRRNDFFRFNFRTNSWTEIFPNDSEPPSARDRHTAVSDGSKNIYIFAGYDGFNRVDDFYRYNTTEAKWSRV